MAEPGDVVKERGPCYSLADWLSSTALDGKVTSQQELPGAGWTRGQTSANKRKHVGKDGGKHNEMLFADVVGETLRCQGSCCMFECLKATLTLWLCNKTIGLFFFFSLNLISSKGSS